MESNITRLTTLKTIYIPIRGGIELLKTFYPNATCRRRPLLEQEKL